jgi:hypothetical protein
MKARGMHTPIAAFVPFGSPLGLGLGGDGEDIPAAGGVEIMLKLWVRNLRYLWVLTRSETRLSEMLRRMLPNQNSATK